MIKVKLWEDTSIRTYQEVVESFEWCINHFGQPGDRWKYGRDADGFLGKNIISSSMEIDNFVFSNDEDALLFKLSW